ncbi:MAG: anthranilate synthase component I family protein [Nocardioidaceae bacterium]
MELSTDPVDVFRAHAAAGPRMFWLDGGGSRDWSGRRSLVATLADDDVSLTYDAGARVVLRHRAGTAEPVGDDVFAVLEQEVARDAGDPHVHWVGYFGYACRPDLPARPATGVPDAVWMRVRDPLVFTHPPGGPGQPPPVGVSGPGPGEYARAFAEVQRQLRLGNSYEVNLTYREAFTAAAHPVDSYLRLRAANPAPYAGYLQHGPVHVLSSSPERFATVDRQRWLETKPIKGTTPRGRTAGEDAQHRAALQTDQRYRAENLMIVDLLRNDLSMVCAPGTVTVPSLMAVESYPSVHQLVSTVRGRLRPEVSTIGALRALFPAGSMTGAPKLRTMQVIDAVEATPRGVYAGAFGWVSADGRADLGVVIRTLVATPAGDGWRYELGTGGGITVHSDVDSELAETRWKAERLRAAVPDADTEQDPSARG